LGTNRFDDVEGAVAVVDRELRHVLDGLDAGPADASASSDA
jgi:hypothetical protein